MLSEVFANTSLLPKLPDDIWLIIAEFEGGTKLRQNEIFVEHSIQQLGSVDDIDDSFGCSCTIS